MSTVAPRPDVPAPASRGRRRAAFAAGGVLVALGALYGAGYALTGNTLPPNTSVGGIPLGGLSPAAAEAELRAKLAPAASALVTLKAGDATVQKAPADLGLGIDYTASLAAAGGGKTFNPAEMIAALTGGRSVPLVVSTDAAKLQAQLTALAASDHGPADATLAMSGVTPTLTPAKDGHALKLAEAPDAVAKAWPASATIELPVTLTPADVTTAEAQGVLDSFAKPAVSAPVTLKAGDKTVEVGADTVAAALTFAPSGGTLVPALDAAKLSTATAERLKALGAKAPTDATIKLTDGKPAVVPSVDGSGVAPDALVAALLPVLPKTSDRVAAVTLTAVHPTFDTAAAEKLGVKEITGEFTTVFPGAYAYRYVNIPKAAGMLTNMLIKPGETFSMNDALGGERTAEKGWAAGFGIMDGKETIQLGGALSQVTTTTYNAVFFAGLEDIEHKPHSLYFSRYPKGREATLSYPGVDMKFHNDSPYGALLQVIVTGHVGVQGTITVRVWSTKQYDVKQANTVISNEKIVSGTTPAQDDSPDCVAQDASDGFDIKFDKQFWQGGKLVKTVPYFWHYNTNLPTVCTNPAAIAAEKARQAAAGG